MKHRLLVTDITNYGELRCVAGWEIDRKKMIRPEPFPGGFWSSSAVGPNGFERTSIAEFDAEMPDPPTAYPHQTEDRVVVGAVKNDGTLDNKECNKLLKQSAFDSLDELFDGNLVVDGSKAYVATGAKCRSLGGIEVPAKGVIVENYTNPKGKDRLRLRFSAGNDHLAPNLTSNRAYEEHQAGRLAEVNKVLAKAKRLHLRLGLARSFPDVPNRCYLQVNGLFILE